MLNVTVVTTRCHDDTKCSVLFGGKAFCVTLFQQPIGELLIAKYRPAILHLLLFEIYKDDL